MRSRQRSRLLILTPWYPHPESPVSGIFVRDQAEILARLFDVLVYFMKPVAGRAILRDMLARHAPEIAEDQGVRVVAGRYHGMPDGAQPLASWLAYRQCRRALGAALHAWGGAPDIIHAHVALPAGWLAVRLGRELGVPAVLTEHTGPFAALIPRPGARGPVEEALTGAAAVLAVSPALASAMHREFPAVRPRVLGNVVRTDFFTLSSRARSGPFRFAALALMTPAKGLDVLLRAVRRLLDHGCTDFRIAIGGDGPERAGLERMAQDLRLHAHVQFPGLLNRPQVRALLHDADVFVLPSLGETFGVAVGEAMACGKPVIATRSGGPEFVLGAGNGVLVPPNDAGALARAMRAAYERRIEWSPAAIRESVERRFSPGAFQAALLEVYGAVGVQAPRRTLAI